MKALSYRSFLIVFMFLLISCGEKPAESSIEQTEIKQTEKATPSKLTEKSEPTCNLTMGWDPWEPYQYLTPDDQVRGLEIDLISSMAKQANCTINFVQDDWMTLLKGIKDGSIDLLGGASKTPAREEFAFFSSAYRHESFVLYLRSEQLNKFADKSLTQLLENKFRLGVTEDYIYGDEISEIQDNQSLASQIISVPITEINYYNLIQNQIDGFLEDPFVAAYTIKRKGLVTQIDASPIEIHSGDVSIMFSKSSVQLETVEAFNQGLETIRASGEYDKILQKYSH